MDNRKGRVGKEQKQRALKVYMFLKKRKQLVYTKQVYKALGFSKSEFSNTITYATYEYPIYEDNEKPWPRLGVLE